MAAVLLPAACGSPAAGHVAIAVDAPSALADQAVRISITGLSPGEEVSLRSAAVDASGRPWHGEAAFRADGHGAVDLGTATPQSGSYRLADGMGLFWSMKPDNGDGDLTLFTPPAPQTQHSYQVRLTATAHGRELAAATVTRQWLTDGTTGAEAHQVNGELYLPPHPDGRLHPCVLLLGGSDGGNSQLHTAALLASHGYPTLSLAYFGLPGLPDNLQNIPLEYFATAAKELAAQPGADPKRLVVLGRSRGSEAALLLGEREPALVHGVVVYSPSADANPGIQPIQPSQPGGPGPSSPDQPAWTEHGAPVPTGPIPLDALSGPVLAVAGGDDRLWPSEAATQRIDRAAPARFTHKALVYPDAGHYVDIAFPYLPAGTRVRLPQGPTLDLGGTPADNEAARQDSWPQLLAFLAALPAQG